MQCLQNCKKVEHKITILKNNSHFTQFISYLFLAWFYISTWKLPMWSFPEPFLHCQNLIFGIEYNGSNTNHCMCKYRYITIFSFWQPFNHSYIVFFGMMKHKTLLKNTQQKPCRFYSFITN